ncbi:DUF5685 family protein [Nocardia puris]
MFGMLRPCSHGAARYGIDASEWRAHLCGLCLGLRDEHGQLARAATNTDALLLGMLTEAQLRAPAPRAEAGPCPLRGMRRARVATADSPGVRLAVTASLLLGAAKIRDHVEDGDSSALARRPMTRVSSRWADAARAQAATIGFDVEPLVAAIDSQARLEREAVAALAADDGSSGSAPRHSARERRHGTACETSDPGESRSRGGTFTFGGEPQGGADPLDVLTSPTQLCAAEFFAHTAVLADRPENVEPLRIAGRHFGRIAHLTDAVEDYDDDVDRFNPLRATGTTLPEAYELIGESDRALRIALAESELAEVSTVRWMLLDPLRSLVHRVGRGMGALASHVCHPAESGHACGTSGDTLASATAFTGGQLIPVAATWGSAPPPRWDERDQQARRRREPRWKRWCERCCDCADCTSSCGNCCGSCGKCGNCCCDC